MENRMFELYKKRIIEERPKTCGNGIRFNVVQYLCYFPNLDPVEMAASLMLDGYQILYDDSSISKEENKRNRHIVEQFVKNFDADKQNKKDTEFKSENSSGTGDGIVNVQEMARLWISLLQKEDPTLKWKL